MGSNVHAASRRGDLQMLQQQVEELQEDINGRDMHQVQDRSRDYFVRFRCWWVPWLNACGAGVNTQGCMQMAPIHYACRRGHAHIVDYLLQACASPVLVTETSWALGPNQRVCSPRAVGTFPREHDDATLHAPQFSSKSSTCSPSVTKPRDPSDEPQTPNPKPRTLNP